MAEKYQARSNGEEVPQKTEQEKKEESSAKLAKVGAKAAANYFLPGVGGAAVDMISKTKLGQQVLDVAGKTLAQNKAVGTAAKKLDDSGGMDLADKATNLIGGNPAGGATNTATKSATDAATSSAANSATDTGSKALGTSKGKRNQTGLNSNSSLSSTSDETSSTKADSSSMLENIFGNGGFDISKLIKPKFIFIGFGGFFVFIILLTVIVSAKDYGNLDITNNSEAMGGYVPESIVVVTPGSISNIEDSSLNGASGKKLSDGQTLNSLLSDAGVNLLSQTITSSAQNAGYGTGAAPAAAAQALIQSLLNNNIVIPYFWGGGHGLISTGANGNWGTSTYVSVGGHSTSYSYQPLGLDCSGFVSWTLYNGGCKNFTPITAANFKLLGASTTFSAAKTGDILASNSHVILILENRGDSLLCAESSTNGVVFSTHTESSLTGYKIVDMSNYYQLYCS